MGPSAAVTVVSGVVLIAVIVVGNGLVMAAVVREPTLRRARQNWLIASLALADALVGILVVPLTLLYEVDGEWRLGWVLCEIWLALDVLFVTASILNLAAISLDSHPLVYPKQRTAGRMSAGVAAVWALSALISFPPLLGWRSRREPHQCTLSSDVGYVIYSAVGSFYLPVFIIVLVYARIFNIIRERSRQRMEETSNILPPFSRPPSDNGTLSPTTEEQRSDTTGQGSQSTLQTNAPSPKISTETMQTLEPIPEGQLLSPPSGASMPLICATPQPPMSRKRSMTNPLPDMQFTREARAGLQGSLKRSSTTTTLFVVNKKRRRLIKQDRKARLTLTLILGSFVACWLPFFVVYLLAGVGGVVLPEPLFDAVFWLGYVNSALNPVIYALLNKKFRSAFHKILCSWKNF